MPISDEQILKILFEEVVPAEGCTEPIALAYAGAKAKEVLGAIPDKVDIFVSGNIIKNVKSVVIPNSGGLVGIEPSVAMGIVAGDSEKELMVISNISKEKMQETVAFIKETNINIHHQETEAKLYIKVSLYKNNECSSVEIKHFHTNITKIEKNGELLIAQACNDFDFSTSEDERAHLSIASVYEKAKNIPIEKIAPLLEKVIALNSTIAEEGLKGTYGINIGQVIQKNIQKGIYGNDFRNNAAGYTAAGSDARMSGCPLPVMTTSGSGNQGMTASLPLIKYAQQNKIPKEKLIRALFFSHLATVHIKSSVGRLSAYCGVICASAAVSGGLCFIQDESLEVVSHAITNTLGNVSGIICDGAKASCAMKIATGIYAAFDGNLLAASGRYLSGGDGIIAYNIEDTLKNIAELSQQGMISTDETILRIMTKKNNNTQQCSNGK